MFLLAACVPDFDAPRPSPPPEIISGPVILPASSPDVALVKMLSVSTDVPSRLTVLLEGADTRFEIAFPALTTQHTEPLLGMVELTNYTATVTVASEAGAVVTAVPVDFNSGTPFAPTPDREVLVHDETRMEPGYTIYPVEAPGQEDVLQLEAIDELGRLVWQYRPPLANTIVATQFHASDGTLSALLSGRTIRRFDLADTQATSWTPVGDAAGGDIPVDVTGFHHEAVFEADGSFWSLAKQDVPVTDYPLDPYDPSVTGPATLDADVVLHIAADGTVLGQWLLTDFLDPHRIGFNATDEVAGGDLAWSHANAVLPLEDDEQTFIVSSRHQDALVKIRGDANQADWILANHDGWAPQYVPLLLEPTSPLLWFTHQHAPAFDADGQLLVFDNGNWQHGNPYLDQPPGTEDVSLMVRYAIDEAARTVTETFSFVADESIDPLFSSLLGNVDEMPITRNLLGTFPYLKQENGIVHVDAGIGDQSVRIIEVDPSDGTVVWDVRLSSPINVSPLGWQSDRAIRVSSLYPADVTVRMLD